MQYKSKIMASIYETAEDLHTAQVMPAQTMREFDALCLTPEEIRSRQLHEEANQAVLRKH